VRRGHEKRSCSKENETGPCAYLTIYEVEEVIKELFRNGEGKIRSISSKEGKKKKNPCPKGGRTFLVTTKQKGPW